MVSPTKILKEAIAAVPAVRYALGISGIVAAIAVIFALGVDARVAIFGTIIMLVLMTLLVIFARLSAAQLWTLRRRPRIELRPGRRQRHRYLRNAAVSRQARCRTAGKNRKLARRPGATPPPRNYGDNSRPAVLFDRFTVAPTSARVRLT